MQASLIDSARYSNVLDNRRNPTKCTSAKGREVFFLYNRVIDIYSSILCPHSPKAYRRSAAEFSEYDSSSSVINPHVCEGERDREAAYFDVR